MSQRFASAIALLVFAISARAETRSFTVTVDKKACGTHHVVIKDRDDGTRLVTSQADVVVKVAFITYKYSFQANETWKASQLVDFRSVTNDNGKKHAVAIEPQGDGLTLQADGQATRLNDRGYTITNYWRKPNVAIPRGSDAPIKLIDADTGKRIDARIESVGVEKITYQGKPFECLHLRVRGGVEVDLWFDGDDLLVRQESIEEGHRTVLELTKLQRE
jgi:hypothetical protein